jgi:hypothetical protein
MHYTDLTKNDEYPAATSKPALRLSPSSLSDMSEPAAISGTGIAWGGRKRQADGTEQSI